MAGGRDLKVTAAAPAKVILTGEHFVVYGEPAIVMAIDCMAYVTVEGRDDKVVYVSSNLGLSGTFDSGQFRPEMGGMEARRVLEPIQIAAQSVLSFLDEKRGLNIEVNSNIPASAGLGSSGAIGVATVAATGKLLGANFTKEKLAQLPFEAEKYVHVKPSGIDQTISTYGGVIVYRKDKGAVPLKVRVEIPLVIGNTGVSRITGDLVAMVRARRDRFPEMMDSLIRIGGRLSVLAAEALEGGKLERLGELMDIDQGLLSAIGVSNEVLDRLIYATRRAGALGGKLTGAGGGGCMIALSPADRCEEVAKAIQDAGGIPVITRKTDRGVQVWVSE